jgi:hypothetical protein
MWLAAWHAAWGAERASPVFAAAFGMSTGGVMIYLADHVDEARLDK